MIKSLSDLHNLFFKEWEIPFRSLEMNDLISRSNSTLLNYVNNFGDSIPKNNNQDHFQIKQNGSKHELINFISENSGNWNIAVDKRSDEIYTNEHWLYTENSFSAYKKLDFKIEECLISFTLQEIYFAYCENDFIVNTELNFKPIWVDKKYNTNEKTHSFFYDFELKALKFNHSENNFERISFIKF